MLPGFFQAQHPLDVLHQLDRPLALGPEILTNRVRAQPELLGQPAPVLADGRKQSWNVLIINHLPTIGHSREDGNKEI